MNQYIVVEDLCDHCQCEATLFCEDCRNSYCSTCSSVRHRTGRRRDHILLKVPNVTHLVPDNPLQPFQKGQLVRCTADEIADESL